MNIVEFVNSIDEVAYHELSDLNLHYLHSVL